MLLINWWVLSSLDCTGWELWTGKWSGKISLWDWQGLGALSKGILSFLSALIHQMAGKYYWSIQADRSGFVGYVSVKEAPPCDFSPSLPWVMCGFMHRRCGTIWCWAHQWHTVHLQCFHIFMPPDFFWITGNEKLSTPMKSQITW